GNFAPIQGAWNDVFLDIPYLKQASNSLEVSICFNNCEYNTFSFSTLLDDLSQLGQLGSTFYDRSDGGSYASLNNECVSSPISFFQSEVPFTRFGYDNVSRKTIEVCSNADSITLIGTSSVIPILQLQDIDNDGINDFNSPVAYTDINYTTYHYRSRGSVFGSINWINADYVCQSIGAHLSHIETKAENNFILNNVQGNRNRWIGAFQNCNNTSFSEPSDGWQWTNGKSVSTNSNINSWNSNEPNNSGGNEHYASMYAANNSSSGLWNDVPITSTQRFLMEVEDIYVWSTGDTTVTAELTVPNTNLNSSSIIWMERLVNEGGRTFKKREYFKIVLNQSPNLALSSSTNAVCPGDTILVSASSATANLFDWNYGQINPISGTITSQNINIDDTLTISVTASDVNNCQTTDSIIINTYQITDLNIQVVDSICDSSFAYISQVQNYNQYCVSRPFDSSFYNVSNVSLNGDNFSINNNTAFTNASYSNYTNLAADVTAGSSYNININLQSSLGYINFGGKVYVDWNRDGDFYDNGEYISDLSFNNSSLYTITLNVPSFAISGNTRLRIVSQYENNSDLSAIGPCDIGSNFSPPYYGETEDYTIFINSSNSATNNYIWSNGIIDTIIYNLSPGFYSASYTDQNGCFSIDSVQVGESALISVLADSNQNICYGGQPNNLTSQSFSSLASTSIQWQPSNFFVNSNISNPQFVNGLSLFSDTIFTVTYGNGLCSSTDTVRVEVNQRPSVSNIIVNPIPACENDTLSIFAITTSPNITQFKFQKRTLSNNNWTNIISNSNGWGNFNPITYGPITETTEFKVKIREDSGCRPSDWGAPTNQGIIVPINNMNNLLIYHN
ncbi:C-type lectin domain-containing protein, partial [Bacteroidota bacterium]|nr:C-type lectin domain-containing protein [Bacteroidota bacterium]